MLPVFRIIGVSIDSLGRQCARVLKEPFKLICIISHKCFTELHLLHTKYVVEDHRLVNYIRNGGSERSFNNVSSRRMYD